MHNNYYLIRQIVLTLQDTLAGARLIECFSQNKDELIMQFALANKGEFTINAHLDPQFTCLSFPDNYRKARKNTAQIFQELYGEKVLNVEGFLNERAFTIHFNNGRSLLFKLFGHQSNILLLNNDQVTAIFRNSLKNDFNLSPAVLNRPIDQSKEAIINVLPLLEPVFPTLDRRTRGAIEQKLINLDANQAYNKLMLFINKLEKPTSYYIIEDEEKIKFSLLPSSKAIFKDKSVIKTINEFFRLYIRTYKYRSEQRSLLNELQHKIKKTEAYISKTRDKMDKLKSSTSSKQIADLIMANLHLIKPRETSIEVENFYTGKTIKIKLNEKLSGQKNAEKYYNKAKNIGLEVGKLEEIIKEKENQLIALKRDIEKVNQSSSVRALQKISTLKKRKTEDKISLFKKFIIEGFTILVGKNAKNNDLLTLKHAKKNDLFFHAKDVSGSHVILKQISGKDFPAAVLEKTAALAAYYSKRKTDSLCPVGYTPKKYVRKPKGSAPGLVIVEREKVLLVKPELPI